MGLLYFLFLLFLKKKENNINITKERRTSPLKNTPYLKSIEFTNSQIHKFTKFTFVDFAPVRQSSNKLDSVLTYSQNSHHDGGEVLLTDI